MKKGIKFTEEHIKYKIMKFTHNQKVLCTIWDTDITDARISINSDGRPFICQNERDGTEADDKLGYKYSWIISRDFTDLVATNLRPAAKSFDNPQIGDEYKDEAGNSRFVLGVTGRVIFLSDLENKDLASGYFIKEELIKDGYTIVQDKEEEVTELTLEEIAKKFGKDVSKIKIKK